MSHTIRCTVEGKPETTALVPCDGDPLEEYWPVRFAVDSYIAEAKLTEGARISVDLHPKVLLSPRGRIETWSVRTRQLGESEIRFGEREQKK